MNRQKRQGMFIMKKIFLVLSLIGTSSLLGACTNTEVGTTAGAAAGAGLGYAVSGGNAFGTVIGAGAGALIGNQIGRHH